MNKLKLITCLFLLSSCAVNQERHRDAKLMPEETAMNVVRSVTGRSWTDSFEMHPSMVLDPIQYSFCSDKTTKNFKSSEVMINRWVNNLFLPFIEIYSKEKFSGYPCFDPFVSRYILQVRVKNGEELEDLIDAYVSLGVKVDVQ